jgi:hypothetical protein
MTDKQEAHMKSVSKTACIQGANKRTDNGRMDCEVVDMLLQEYFESGYRAAFKEMSREEK